MDSDRWRRVRELFDAAADLRPSDRASFLDEACGGDALLRAEVESLLLQDLPAPGALTDIVVEAAAQAARDEAGTSIGRRIGPYRIVGELGHGGMGSVYLAVRADDVYRKTVAIKLIRGACSRPDLLERFKSERQILAGMDHPNIARLLDGGATEEGEPYVVMERVEGEPIDEYCDSHGLTTEQRLVLFRTVCGAVQYAHRNLVVHRDLKPANILVTGDGVPKLLDFGIAKLIDPEAPPARGGTATGVRAMTPQYASPEQVKGAPITTGTDVYSLGVLLHVLLVGCLPYRAGTDQPRDLERAICEEEPERPSAAAARRSGRPAHGRTAPTAGAAPREDPRRLARRLAGDLDNIVLKSLRKEPERRYVTVEQLSEDVRRHLEGLPVVARPSTLLYRTRKLVSRHRTGVAGAAAAVLLIAALVGFYTVRLSIARDRAETESVKSAHVSEFLVGLFGISDPERSRGAQVTARELLDEGARKIGESLGDQPEARATLMETMGRAYVGLGLFESARPLLEESLEARRRALGPDHPDVATGLQALGELMYEMGEYEKAAEITRESLALNSRLHGEQSEQVALNLNDLGWLLYDRGEYDEAEALHRRALSIRRRMHRGDSADVAESLNNLGSALAEKGDREGGERLMSEALAMRRRLFGETHPLVAYTLNNLAVVLEMRGELERAEASYREALTVDRRLYGDEHPDLATGQINLARLLRRRGKLDEAEALAREAVAIDRRFRGEDHPFVAYGLHQLGDVQRARGDLHAAEASYVESIAIYRRKVSPGDLSLAGPLESYGALLLERGRADAAEPLLKESLGLRRAALRPPHETLAATEGTLGDCLGRLRRFHEAEALLLQSHASLRDLFRDEDRRTQEAIRRLAALYDAWGEPEKAAAWKGRLGAGEAASPAIPSRDAR